MTTTQTAGAHTPAEFPKQSLSEAAHHLARPFTAAAIEFLVVATFPKDQPTGAFIACYVSRVTAEDRLDTVVGPDNWEVEYRPLDNDTMLCALTVFGVTKQAVGQGSNRWSQEANAFKRACKLFGIGRYLYKMKQVRLQTSQLRRSGKSWFVPDALAEHLRTGYTQRVKATYEALYGEPLDHNDVIGQFGDEGEERSSDPEGETIAEQGPGEGSAPPAPQPAPAEPGAPAPEPPAASAQPMNDTLRKAIERTPYPEPLARALGAFLYDGRPLEELTAQESTELVELLLSAYTGNINPATLTAAIERGSVAPDRVAARGTLRQYIADRARQATGAQAA